MRLRPAAIDCRASHPWSNSENAAARDSDGSRNREGRAEYQTVRGEFESRGAAKLLDDRSRSSRNPVAVPIDPRSTAFVPDHRNPGLGLVCCGGPEISMPPLAMTVRRILPRWWDPDDHADGCRDSRLQIEIRTVERDPLGPLVGASSLFRMSRKPIARSAWS